MSNRSYYVTALWDEDAKVFYSDSDIRGLHVEAATLREFDDIVKDTAIELIIANHISAEDLATKSIKDLIPSIFRNTPPAELTIA